MFWGVKIEIGFLWEATLSKPNYRSACLVALPRPVEADILEGTRRSMPEGAGRRRGRNAK